VDFFVLGLLEAVFDGRLVKLGGVREQTILAMLLLEPARTAGMARLVESLYGDSPPPTARSQVQICVSALRRLFTAHGLQGLISTQSQRYTLQVPYEQIDAYRFQRLLEQARQARDTGRRNEAIRHYRAGLALWRGPALEGIDSRLVQSMAGRLAEDRVTGNEECIEQELALGRHHRLVGELTALTAEHPLRERLRGQLMVSLYRSGRRAEALEVFENTKKVMLDELGLEPNASLQQLERQILRRDPALEPRQTATMTPAARVPGAPMMLPTDVADFTGREGEVETIRELLLLGTGGTTRAVPIIVLVGNPGIGKTTIAVHVSHSVAAQFPDGRLFADLHGGVSQPVGPMQVLERFLRVMGVPGDALPATLDERAETYRALLCAGRTLVLLDDVHSENEVLPMLPGSSDSAVIVTSRSRLAGLPGAIHVSLGTFKLEQSVELLAKIIGAERAAAEPAAVEELATLCGRLPLALRIAGVRLAARPHWTIGQLVDRLRDETRRLDELKHGEMGIRASISLTYETVGEEARRLFRRLAILDTQLFSAWVAAALLDRPLAEALDLLDDLIDAQLVESVGDGRGAQSQYRFHDLIRVFAREHLAAEEPPAERRAALARVLGGLLSLADAAHRRKHGGHSVHIRSRALRWQLPEGLADQLVAAPMSWYERERAPLVTGIRQAAQAGFADLCWGLAISAVTLFESSVYLDDWRETHQIALEVTRQADDKLGQAAMLYSTGSLHLTEQRFDDARTSFESAVRLFEEVGDEQGTALVIRNLGVVDRLTGRLDDAVLRHERALELFRGLGEPIAIAYVLNDLAELKLEAGDFAAARSLLAEALRLSAEGGNRRMQAQVLHRLGHAHLKAAEPARAVRSFEESLAIVRDIGDVVGESYARYGIGVALLRTGDPAAAGQALRGALSLAGVAHARHAEARILVGLGELAMRAGRPREAVRPLTQALAHFRMMDVPMHEARALLMLSGAHRAQGEEQPARDALDAAMSLAGKLDPWLGDRPTAQIEDMLGAGNPYFP
jgi:DNA-binding SARP family transcriptional activator/tetratricopeptide (TPR) repeat protein